MDSEQRLRAFLDAIHPYYLSALFGYGAKQRAENHLSGIAVGRSAEELADENPLPALKAHLAILIKDIEGLG